MEHLRLNDLAHLLWHRTHAVENYGLIPSIVEKEKCFVSHVASTIAAGVRAASADVFSKTFFLLEHLPNRDISFKNVCTAYESLSELPMSLTSSRFVWELLQFAALQPVLLEKRNFSRLVRGILSTHQPIPLCELKTPRNILLPVIKPYIKVLPTLLSFQCGDFDELFVGSSRNLAALFDLEIPKQHQTTIESRDERINYNISKASPSSFSELIMVKLPERSSSSPKYKADLHTNYLNGYINLIDCNEFDFCCQTALDGILSISDMLLIHVRAQWINNMDILSDRIKIVCSIPTCWVIYDDDQQLNTQSANHAQKKLQTLLKSANVEDFFISVSSFTKEIAEETKSFVLEKIHSCLATIHKPRLASIYNQDSSLPKTLYNFKKEAEKCYRNIINLKDGHIDGKELRIEMAKAVFPISEIQYQIDSEHECLIDLKWNYFETDRDEAINKLINSISDKEAKRNRIADNPLHPLLKAVSDLENDDLLNHYDDLLNLISFSDYLEIEGQIHGPLFFVDQFLKELLERSKVQAKFAYSDSKNQSSHLEDFAVGLMQKMLENGAGAPIMSLCGQNMLLEIPTVSTSILGKLFAQMNKPFRIVTLFRSERAHSILKILGCNDMYPPGIRVHCLDRSVELELPGCLKAGECIKDSRSILLFDFCALDKFGNLSKVPVSDIQNLLSLFTISDTFAINGLHGDEIKVRRVIGMLQTCYDELGLSVKGLKKLLVAFEQVDDKERIGLEQNCKAFENSLSKSFRDTFLTEPWFRVCPKNLESATYNHVMHGIVRGFPQLIRSNSVSDVRRSHMNDTNKDSTTDNVKLSDLNENLDILMTRRPDTNILSLKPRTWISAYAEFVRAAHTEMKPASDGNLLAQALCLPRFDLTSSPPCWMEAKFQSLLRQWIDSPDEDSSESLDEDSQKSLTNLYRKSANSKSGIQTSDANLMTKLAEMCPSFPRSVGTFDYIPSFFCLTQDPPDLILLRWVERQLVQKDSDYQMLNTTNAASAFAGLASLLSSKMEEIVSSGDIQPKYISQECINFIYTILLGDLVPKLHSPAGITYDPSSSSPHFGDVPLTEEPNVPTTLTTSPKAKVTITLGSKDAPEKSVSESRSLKPRSANSQAPLSFNRKPRLGVFLAIIGFVFFFLYLMFISENQINNIF